ncbi:MAG: response regulator transcription factor [Chloroflexi bacterium]|nr:response regulator transcription factor [Chloroflexota bacterium]MCI0647657.1 response regulator transcription factor [Chloroflexota bacterium]MCI0730087.1 response regulator transcription factor [Chloroflexota bacterium]
MIRVLVADDHAVVRRGVREILEEEPLLAVAGEASSGRDVLRAVREEEYDLVLLDVALPDMNGLEVLHQLRTIKPTLKVLILSMYPEHQYAIRALRAGAAGYLTKESAPDELVAAVQRVSQGGKYVSRELAEMMAEFLANEGEALPHSFLSDREYQVMVLLAKGKTVSEIAGELSLSVKTVSTYRHRVLTKLHLQSTADIIRYAFQHGLVE